MKVLRRLLLLFGILLLLVLGTAFLIPVLFKDQLLLQARKVINEQVDARVDFADVNLSLFRDFPHISLGLEGLTVDGNAPFEGIRLVALEELAVSLDLFSVIFSDRPLSVRSVRLYRPDLKVYVLRDGKANYDIAKAEDVPAEAQPEGGGSDFTLQLSNYEIVEGNILYDDRQTGLLTRATGLNHRGSGNFTQDVFDLNTRTTIQELTLTYAGTSYLNRTEVVLDALLNIDQGQSKYTLTENDLRINALRVLLDGYVQLLDNEQIGLDLSLRSPQNEFRSLLSLLPNAYTRDFEQVRTSGQFALQASAEGTYDPVGESYPAFDLQLQVDNGRFQYPDLPLPIEEVFANARIQSPGGALDRMRINIERFDLRVGDNPFSARLQVATPLSDPDVDAVVDGTIDLEALSRAYPMEGVDQLSGRLVADLEAKARLSTLEAGNYEQVNMSGGIQAEKVNYQGTGLPPVQVESAALNFTPRYAELEEFSARLGKSDLRGSGRFDNILAYLSTDKVMTGQLRLRSSFFDANEWYGEEPEADEQAQQVELLNAEAEEEAEPETFKRFDLGLDAAFERLLYDEYDLRNAVARGQFSPERLEVEQLSARIGQSDIRARGRLTHVWEYLFEEGLLSGRLNLNSSRLDLNELLGLEEEEPDALPMEPEVVVEEEVYRVPGNLNLTIGTDIGRVDYSNMTLNDLNGAVVIKDQAVVLDNVSARTLGGRVGLTGRYDTKGTSNPEVAVKMDLQSMNFQEAFETFNTFEKLAPIGKFISGKFNTNFLFEGELNEAMYPVLSTINAEGFLQTVDAVLRQYKPVQAIGNALNVKEMQGAIPLENTKNWFEVRNGLVEIKPVKMSFLDMAFTVSGTHGLNSDMDYTIDARIPRSVWENNAVGAAIGVGVDQLRTEAAKLGLEWEKSEFVDVAIGLTGSMTNPKVKVDLLGMEGSASLGDAAKKRLQEEAAQKQEELEREAEAKLEEGKEKAQELIEEAQDTAQAKAEEMLEKGVEEAKKKAAEALKEDTVVQKVVEDLGEAVGEQAKKVLGDSSKTVETIKKELEKFNPFKRKKKTKPDTSGKGGS